MSSPSPVSPFRGRWLLPTVLVTLLTIAFLLLGVWQLQRRAQRLATNAHVLARLSEPPLTITGAPVSADAVDLRRGTVRGVFDYDQEIVLRNRSYNEQPGLHVLAPLIIDSGAAPVAILVDRGWIPYELAAPADRAQFHNTNGEVEVYGVLRKTQERRGALSPVDPVPGAERRVDNWHRVDLAKIQKQVPYTLLPVFLEEDVRPGERLRAFPRPQPDISLDEGSHLGYAIQWFAFAILAPAGYAGFYSQRARLHRPQLKSHSHH